MLHLIIVAYPGTTRYCMNLLRTIILNRFLPGNPSLAQSAKAIACGPKIPISFPFKGKAGMGMGILAANSTPSPT
jgi:hypothetical protein